MEEGRKNRPNTIHLHTPILVHDSNKNHIGFFGQTTKSNFLFFTNSYGVGVIENLCMFIPRREVKNSTLSKYVCSPSLMCVNKNCLPLRATSCRYPREQIGIGILSELYHPHQLFGQKFTDCMFVLQLSYIYLISERPL